MNVITGQGKKSLLLRVSKDFLAVFGLRRGLLVFRWVMFLFLAKVRFNNSIFLTKNEHWYHPCCCDLINTYE
jgi:hypothetical protein